MLLIVNENGNRHPLLSFVVAQMQVHMFEHSTYIMENIFLAFVWILNEFTNQEDTELTCIYS